MSVLFQDYDITKLSRDEWVAVAYDNNRYFVGQIEEINYDDVKVNFLTKSSNNDLFYWPHVPDKANVQPTVIFYPSVKVVKDGRRYKIHDLKDIVTSFKEFSQKYF